MGVASAGGAKQGTCGGGAKPPNASQNTRLQLYLPLYPLIIPEMNLQALRSLARDGIQGRKFSLLIIEVLGFCGF